MYLMRDGVYGMKMKNSSKSQVRRKFGVYFIIEGTSLKGLIRRTLQRTMMDGFTSTKHVRDTVKNKLTP